VTAAGARAAAAAPGSDVARRMAAAIGGANVLTDPAELLVYEADGLTHGRARPAMVVLPGSTAEVVEVVSIARDAGVSLLELRPTDESLEGVFSYLVNR